MMHEYLFARFEHRKAITGILVAVPGQAPSIPAGIVEGWAERAGLISLGMLLRHHLASAGDQEALGGNRYFDEVFEDAMRTLNTLLFAKN